MSHTHVIEIRSGGGSYLILHPEGHQVHRAKARDMSIRMVRQHQPKERKDPYRKYPTTFDTILEHRDRRRRRARAMSGSLRILHPSALCGQSTTRCKLTDENTHEETPNTDEEYRDHNDDSPRWNADSRPQELPVSPIRSGEPVRSKHLGDQEPDDQLSSHESFEEVRNIWRNLVYQL